MSDSEASSEDGNDAAANLNTIVQPLRKQIKKQGSKIEKLESLCKAAEKARAAEVERREASEHQLAILQASLDDLKNKLDSNPWLGEGEKLMAELHASEKRLGESLNDTKVQLGAHAQVFQTTQSAVSSQAQGLAAMQAEASEGSLRVAEEIRGMNARLDHMRGEFSERVTHTFTETTGHADRLVQRLQQEIQRLDQEVALRATSKTLADTSGARGAPDSRARRAARRSARLARVRACARGRTWSWTPLHLSRK